MSDQPQFLKKDHATLVRDLLRDLADPAGGRVALSDAHEGSVVRTLVEAFAHELAVAYEQIGAVYRLGYLESAEGRALDQVVALVGLARQRGGHAEGLLRFSRATPAPAAIRIPVGTLVAGRGAPEIEVADLAGLALELALWGAADLPFLTPPPAGPLAEAQALLKDLGALRAPARATPTRPRRCSPTSPSTPYAPPPMPSTAAMS